MDMGPGVDDVREYIKRVIAERLQPAPAAIGDDTPLFGSSSAVQLDSVEVLEVLMAVKSHFRLRLPRELPAADVDTATKMAHYVLHLAGGAPA